MAHNFLEFPATRIKPAAKQAKKAKLVRFPGPRIEKRKISAYLDDIPETIYVPMSWPEGLVG